MEDEFEAPAHHEHAVEHQATHEKDSFSAKIAVLTAVFVCFGAFTSYLSNETQAHAITLKNEAIRLRTHASDVWAQSQAQSQKAHLDQLALYVAPETDKASLVADAKAREKKKDGLQEQAKKLDEQSDQANEKAESLERPHGRLSLAMTFIQVSIAICAISALTRKRWLLGLAGASFVGSLALTASAWL